MKSPLAFSHHNVFVYAIPSAQNALPCFWWNLTYPLRPSLNFTSVIVNLLHPVEWRIAPSPLQVICTYIKNCYLKRTVMFYYSYLHVCLFPTSLWDLWSLTHLGFPGNIPGNRFSLDIWINESSYESVDFTWEKSQLQNEILAQANLTHKYVCYNEY